LILGLLRYRFFGLVDFGLLVTALACGWAGFLEEIVLETAKALVCQCHAQCRSLYQRLVNKGKSKKLALIAVCNKLIKQAFAIAKSGIPYDRDYRSSIVCQ